MRKWKPEHSRAQPMDVSMYADLFLEHQLAQRNIAEHGPIVFHPRTGAPIDNPYISIRDKAAKRLRDMRIKAGDLW